MKRLDQESSKQSRLNDKEEVIQSQPVINRRSSRPLSSDELTSSIISHQEEFIEEQTNDSNRVFSSKNTFLILFCVIT